MNSWQIIGEIIIWSTLWIGFIMVSVRVFPFTIEHDYPLAVREKAQLPRVTKAHKRKGILFGTVGFTTLFGMLLFFVLLHFNKETGSFWAIFQYIWMLCIAWNLIDFLVVDCLLICCLSCRFLVLPGTEECRANKNYLFHFIGFLKGCVTMTVIALLFSAISYLIIQIQ